MRLAITGGVAEGKSTVVRYLQDLGYVAASADAIAHDVFEAEGIQTGLAALLGRDSPVSRHDVRDAISRAPGLRRAVNRLMHPLVLRALDESAATIFEVPLLLETCLQGRFDRVWVVTCGPDEQLRRLATRLNSEQKAKEMLSIQLPTAAKIPFADKIIRTNQPEEAVIHLVKEAIAGEIGR